MKAQDSVAAQILVLRLAEALLFQFIYKSEEDFVSFYMWRKMQKIYDYGQALWDIKPKGFNGQVLEMFLEDLVQAKGFDHIMQLPEITETLENMYDQPLIKERSIKPISKK